MVKFRTETSKNILRLMQDNPFVTYKKMSETTGVNISALQKMIDRMKQKGYLERQSKENCWYVFAISTKNVQ